MTLSPQIELSPGLVNILTHTRVVELKSSGRQIVVEPNEQGEFTLMKDRNYLVNDRLKFHLLENFRGRL